MFLETWIRGLQSKPQEISLSGESINSFVFHNNLLPVLMDISMLGGLHVDLLKSMLWMLEVQVLFALQVDGNPVGR